MLHLFSVCFYIEAERMYVNFSSSCGNWHTIFPFLSSSSFPANAANRYLDRVDFRFSLSPSRVQNSTSPRHCCTASRKAANLYGWSRSWFVSSVIAVLRGAASHYLAEYGGKIAAGTIMQFLTDLLQRFVCSC